MKSQEGLTLIEILASIVILSIIILVTANFFVQGSKFSRVSDEKFSDIQIARDILSVYQTKDSSELFLRIGNPRTEINIIDELQVESDQQSYYQGRKAFVAFREHPDPRIKTDVVVIEVVVQSNTSGIKNETVLEGYSR
ncbi:prepilin-type N-terminal cleavage/methylation domain-containing protein [Bacillus sinesaloumensis]|uniref:prepilin-type N-terminal cleavage/methylation domain-containing protein n=1 Tax=Litchfieldia sinesaloumensis TaxID=1926280 RepID=UPI0013564A74|nr:prepilin-type N-terminal cleavage/methylation domain-containing protein [Bacillus sinesaloumensis]